MQQSESFSSNVWTGLVKQGSRIDGTHNNTMCMCWRFYNFHNDGSHNCNTISSHFRCHAMDWIYTGSGYSSSESLTVYTHYQRFICTFFLQIIFHTKIMLCKIWNYITIAALVIQSVIILPNSMHSSDHLALCMVWQMSSYFVFHLNWISWVCFAHIIWNYQSQHVCSNWHQCTFAHLKVMHAISWVNAGRDKMSV